MTRKTTLILALGAVLALALLLVALLVALLLRGQPGDDTVPIADSTPDAGAADAQAEAVDPYAGRELESIQRVQRLAVGDGAETVGERIARGALREEIEAYRRLQLDEGHWSAERDGTSTVYTVEYRHDFHEVRFGPVWRVQLDPEGEQAEGAKRGVLGTNALAAYLLADDAASLREPLNRSDEVLRALTSHRFDGGLRLGSALLSHLSEADRTGQSELIGWLVVPDEISGDERLVYQSWFQWDAGGATRIAHWEVDLLNSQFVAKNLAANEIMARGRELVAEDIVDIRPEQLDTSSPIRRVRDARIRALRHVLADARLVEAVGGLLAFKRRQSDLEYRGWRSDPVDDDRYRVSYRFEEAGEEREVVWHVDADSGEIEPESEIARLAGVALSLAGASEDDEPETDDGDE